MFEGYSDEMERVLAARRASEVVMEGSGGESADGENEGDDEGEEGTRLHLYNSR